MSGRIETPRKRGPFDPRWMSRRIDGSALAPLLPAAEAAEALDWSAFSARYFHGQHRQHHLQTVTAYAAYRRGREWRNSGLPKPPRLRLVPNDRIPPVIDAESELTATRLLWAAAAAVQMQEGEGGRRYP
jgi:hypothetical protein